MVRLDDNNRVVRGVLNDFDHAVDLNKQPDFDSSLTHRTGTLPFLAIDLLNSEPPAHSSLHNLESLLYVYLWDAVQYHLGKRQRYLPKDSPEGPKDDWLQDWRSTNLQRNQRAKIGLYDSIHKYPIGDREVYSSKIRLIFFDLHSYHFHLSAKRQGIVGVANTSKFSFKFVLEEFLALDLSCSCSGSRLLSAGCV